MANYRKSTAAQRAEIERLAGEGLSIRAIAAEMFGHARYKGRVERILKTRTAQPSRADPAQGPASAAPDLSGMTTPQALRVLQERRIAWNLARDEPASMNELKNLVQVEQALRTMEQLERIQQLHRERRHPKPAPPPTPADEPPLPAADNGQREPTQAEIFDFWLLDPQPPTQT